MDWAALAEPATTILAAAFFGGRIVGRLDSLERSVTRIEQRMDAHAQIPLDFGDDSDDDEEDLSEAARTAGPNAKPPRKKSA